MRLYHRTHRSAYEEIITSRRFRGRVINQADAGAATIDFLGNYFTDRDDDESWGAFVVPVDIPDDVLAGPRCHEMPEAGNLPASWFIDAEIATTYIADIAP